MTTVLAERALAANVEQSAFRYVRQLEGAPDADKDKVAQLKSEYSLKARQATAAFNDLAHALVPWLVDRVASVGRASDEIQFKNAARHHRIPAMAVDDWSGDYVPPDQILDEAWDQERDARKALVEQVTALLDLPHPPAYRSPGVAGGVAQSWPTGPSPGRKPALDVVQLARSPSNRQGYLHPLAAPPSLGVCPIQMVGVLVLEAASCWPSAREVDRRSPQPRPASPGRDRCHQPFVRPCEALRMAAIWDPWGSFGPPFGSPLPICR
jgi:hypothetical protein